MAILKDFQSKSPTFAFQDVICISDDDSNSDEDYDFEDVVIGQTASVCRYTEATFEKVVDETINEDENAQERSRGDAHSDSGVADSLLPPDHGGARRREDGSIATDWDGYVHGGETPRMGSTDSDREGSHDPALLDPKHASLRGILVELDALRDRVAQLEARQHACQAKSPSKRSRRTSIRPRAKRRRNNSTVNISATRAYVQWDDSSERCSYTWKRGGGGYGWFGDTEGGAREKVDGEYLLSCATALSVELRANADWLPIEVRYNEDKEVFEGQASVGSQRLEVTGLVMMDMMCGAKGVHTASVCC